MRIEVLTSGPFETNSYILISKMNDAILVDPTFDSFDFFIEILTQQNLTPLAIFLTHSHIDHIVDVPKLKKELNIPVYIHELDQGNLKHPGSDGLPIGSGFQGVNPDVTFKDGDILRLKDFHIVILHTPGHSFGSSCFYLPDEGVLISGDTLFKGTYGNISFPTAEPIKMKESLKRLSLLPKETVIWPGHGDPTTIEEEEWLNHLDEFF